MVHHSRVVEFIRLLYRLEGLLRDKQILLQHLQLHRSLQQILLQRLQLLLDEGILRSLLSNLILFLLEVRLYLLNEPLLHLLQLFNHYLIGDIRCLVYSSVLSDFKKEFLFVSYSSFSMVSFSLSEVFLMQVLMD